MTKKNTHDNRELNEALKQVETFECTVCGRKHPMAQLQQDHILRLKLYGSVVEYPVCNECWVLAWCKKFESLEKLYKTGYRHPARIRDMAPLGAKIIGCFTDHKIWERL